MENDRDILLVAIFTFFTVFVWIGFELLQTSKTSTIPESTAALLKPLESKLDADVLDIIGQRKIYR